MTTLTMEKCNPDDIHKIFESLNDYKNFEDWEFLRDRFLREPLCINELDKIVL